MQGWKEAGMKGRGREQRDRCVGFISGVSKYSVGESLVRVIISGILAKP